MDGEILTVSEVPHGITPTEPHDGDEQGKGRAHQYGSGKGFSPTTDQSDEQTEIQY